MSMQVILPDSPDRGRRDRARVDVSAARPAPRGSRVLQNGGVPPGRSLLMVTDGVSEALEDGVSPATRLVSIVRPLVQAGLDDVVAAVLSATSVKQEASLAPPDDQTVVAFRLRD